MLIFEAADDETATTLLLHLGSAGDNTPLTNDPQNEDEQSNSPHLGPLRNAAPVCNHRGTELFGRLLTWLNDHTTDVFFVGTCNQIERLPPEFARAERFDGVVFVDLPGVEQRESIWRMYLAKFGLDSRQKRPADDEWTGAEIRACCRLAALLDVPLEVAAQNVVPIARTAAESIERLRTWAAGRCLDAERGGIYQAAGSGKGRRRVTRGSGDPSAN